MDAYEQIDFLAGQDYEDPEGDGAVTGKRTLHVLLVEDAETVLRLLTRQLEQLDCQVLSVNNGLEALESWATVHFDLMLMDLEMPCMNGYEAAEQIRLREKPYSRTPIYAITGSDRPNDHRRCMQAGMNGVLIKPIQEAELRVVLDSLRKGG